MSHVPTGGPSAIKGMIYQASWCLLRLTQFTRVAAPDSDPSGVGATLVLEPHDGGDAQEIRGGERVIVQLKSRSDGGAWSLQDMITGVFPDLLKAVRDDGVPTRYQFVTEGHISREWKSVYEWFGSLEALPAESDLLGPLPFAPLLAVGRRVQKGTRPFWDQRAYAPRDLFAKIARHLYKEPTAEDLGRLRKLLRNFEFVGSLSQSKAVADIDRVLEEIVPRREDVSVIREAMKMKLLDWSTHGTAPVTADQILTEFRCQSLASRHLHVMQRETRESLTQRLYLCGYVPEQHVQTSFTTRLASLVEQRRVVLITGPSGSGKTWHGMAVADHLADNGALVAHLEAGERSKTTLDDGVSVLLNQIMKHDQALSFDRATERLPGPPPLRALVIDRVDDPQFARSLIIDGLRARNLQLVLCCGDRASQEVRGLLPKSSYVMIQVESFTHTELNDYLDSRGIDSSQPIPGDVRELITTPMMARIYCDLAPSGWVPSNEYDLLDHYWSQYVGQPLPQNGMFEIDLLHDLARELLKGTPYPWPRPFVAKVAKSYPAAIENLRRCGWLRIDPDGTWLLWHDRLLNWLVADMLTDDFTTGSLSLNSLQEHCRESFAGELSRAGRNLGYVAMDVLWMLCKRKASPTAIASVLAALEQTRARSELYDTHLRSLGPDAVPGLLTRLDQILTPSLKPDRAMTTTEIELSAFDAVKAAFDDMNVGHAAAIALIRCASALGGERVVAKARELLASDIQSHQSSGIQILRENADPVSLDRIWELHLKMEGHKDDVIEYSERMAAMSTAIARNSAWLTRRLSQSRANTPRLSDLVFLLARQPRMRSEWMRLKDHLKVVVPSEKSRCLSMCIRRFADDSERDFLQREAVTEEDFRGDTALSVLTQLDPELAISMLAESQLPFLQLTRSWHFHRLLAARPEQLQNKMRPIFETRSNLLIDLYAGVENQLSAELFELVLDDLERAARYELSQPTPDPSSGYIHAYSDFIREVSLASLLDRLRRRAGTSLDDALVDYLLRIGPRPTVGSRLVDKDVVSILDRMGSRRLSEVFVAGLQGDSWYGRLDAASEAHKHADIRLINLLSQRAEEVSSDHGKYVSYECVHALARLGRWDILTPFVIRHGLAVSPYLFEERGVRPPLPSEVVKEVRDLIASGDTRPGVLLAAGLCRDPALVHPISKIVAEPMLEPDAVLAAAIALACLNGIQKPAIDALIPHLGDSSRGLRIATLLASIGTTECLEPLADHVSRKFDPAMCAMLGGNEAFATRAAELTWLHRDSLSRSPAAADLIRLLGHLKRDDVKRFLERAAHAPTGLWTSANAQLAAIEGLAKHDGVSAVRMATAMLNDSLFRHRADLPRVMMRAAPRVARSLLLERFSKLDDEQMEYAIADELASDPDSAIELTTQTITFLQSDSDEEKRLGMVLAARQQPVPEIADRLRQLALAGESVVAAGAIAALKEQTRSSTIRELVDVALDPGTSMPRRGTILDHVAYLVSASRHRSQAVRHSWAALDQRLSPLEAMRFNNGATKGNDAYGRAAAERTAKRPRERDKHE